MQFQLNWLRAVRDLTQYLVPGFIAAAVIMEIAGGRFASQSLTGAYDYLLAIIFSLLTVLMIGIWGWAGFLWGIDRRFVALGSKIDSGAGAVTTNPAAAEIASGAHQGD